MTRVIGCDMVLVEILNGISSDTDAELVIIGLFLFCVGAAAYAWRSGRGE